MNEFNDEELMNLIQWAETLTEEKRTDLRARVAEALDSGTMDSALRRELIELFEREMKHLEEEVIPEAEKNLGELSDKRKKQVNTIRPDLERLVEDYEHDTVELMREYEEAFRVIDGEFDAAVQEALSHQESQEISALQAKLKKK